MIMFSYFDWAFIVGVHATPNSSDTHLAMDGGNNISSRESTSALRSYLRSLIHHYIRPLNPPILGDFEESFIEVPQYWGI
jgi:hypothetical protein